MAIWLLVLGLPVLIFWGLSLSLEHGYRAALTRDGSGGAPAAIAEAARQLATARMNGWLEAIPGIVNFAIFVLLGSTIWAVPSVPGGRARRLRTPRLLMRRLEPEDIEDVHALFADPEALTLWGAPPHASIEDTRKWLDSHAEAAGQDEFALIRKGALIGILGTTQWPFLHFLLARPHWNRGYGTEAARAFVDYASDRALPFLLSTTDVRNIGARRLLEKVGFAPVDTFPLTHEATGETIEAIVYIRHARWLKRRKRAKRLEIEESLRTAFAAASAPPHAMS